MRRHGNSAAVSGRRRLLSSVAGEAACRGASEGASISIPSLPSFDTVANEYAALVVPTKLGRQIGRSTQARLTPVATA